MRVVVAGGSGFIGSAVCRLLRARGHDAIVLSRKRKNDPTWCTWDDVRTRGLPECDAVVTLCGENFLDSRWTASRKAALEASRIDTTKELVALCQEMARPPRVFVQASGVGFYPPSESATYDEKYSGPPANDYAGWLTQAWEQASDPLAQPSSHTKRVLMRTGVVLGQGGALAAMRLPFGLAYLGRLGSGTQVFPWVHLDDVAALYVTAVEADSPPPVVHAAAPQRTTNGQFAAALREVFYRPTLYLPAILVNLVLGERASVLLKGQDVAPTYTQRIPFQFKYTRVADALAAIRDSHAKSG